MPKTSLEKDGKPSLLPPSNAVELIWGCGDLVIRNVRPEILKVLFYNHRKFYKDDSMAQKEIVESRVNLFTEVAPGIVNTFQGFLDLVIRTCEEHDIPYQFADMRLKMPVPKIQHATGFRFSQRDMFFQLLARNRSGIFKAPTRYGKTIIMANVLRVFPGVQTVVTAPGVNLLAQLHGQLSDLLPDREIRGIYTGSKGKKQSEDITVVSMDSLHKIDTEAVKLVLIDEPHSAAAPTRITEMMKFRHARIYGFGATTTGRFDGGDKLITGAIGPVIVEKSFKEAVTEGAICPIKVYMVRCRFSPFSAFSRDQAYRKVIFHNPHFNQMVRQVLSEIVPADWQTMVFIDEIKQADLMQELVVDGVVTVASRMDDAERKRRYDDMVNDVTKRCICTDIYATGITFPGLRVIVNAAGGGGSITSTQKPGRLAEIRPGKQCGYLIDFLFVADEERNFGRMNHWRDIQNDCYARMNNYKHIGFDVKIVVDLKDIQLT